ncbi:MAG TPA: hypothetical protein VEX63_08870 [Flavisolibacter sp.]|jgi:hypothetical protein|nr:hypothetical protein [Flavisolibacter sp.]
MFNSFFYKPKFFLRQIKSFYIPSINQYCFGVESIRKCCLFGKHAIQEEGGCFPFDEDEEELQAKKSYE